MCIEYTKHGYICKGNTLTFFCLQYKLFRYCVEHGLSCVSEQDIFYLCSFFFPGQRWGHWQGPLWEVGTGQRAGGPRLHPCLCGIIVCYYRLWARRQDFLHCGHHVHETLQTHSVPGSHGSAGLYDGHVRWELGFYDICFQNINHPLTFKPIQNNRRCIFQ